MKTSRNFKLEVLLIISLLVQGCATAYRGPGPDLSLRGEAAKAEYEKFEMSESFWNGGATPLGPSNQLYTRESLRPILAEVSPDAIQSMDRARKWQKAVFVSFGFAMAGLLGSLLAPSGSSTQAILFGGGLTMAGVELGCGVISDINLAQSGEEFNRDLRRRLEISESIGPQVRLSMGF